MASKDNRGGRTTSPKKEVALLKSKVGVVSCNKPMSCGPNNQETPSDQAQKCMQIQGGTAELLPWPVAKHELWPGLCDFEIGPRCFQSQWQHLSCARDPVDCVKGGVVLPKPVATFELRSKTNLQPARWFFWLSQLGRCVFRHLSLQTKGSDRNQAKVCLLSAVGKCLYVCLSEKTEKRVACCMRLHFQTKGSDRNQ
jgi:hypothetical protein